VVRGGVGCGVSCARSAGGTQRGGADVTHGEGGAGKTHVIDRGGRCSVQEVGPPLHERVRTGSLGLGQMGNVVVGPRDLR